MRLFMLDINVRSPSLHISKIMMAAKQRCLEKLQVCDFVINVDGHSPSCCPGLNDFTEA